MSLPLLLAVIELELQSLDETRSEARVYPGEAETMSNESQIKWVSLNLKLPDEVGARLERLSQEAGLSIKCYCVRVLVTHFMKDASPDQKERWQRDVPATLRRNGCEDTAEL
jgi:hypothetical protein